MTPETLSQQLTQYRAGLEAQVAMLRQLESVSLHQHEVSKAADFHRFADASDSREQVMRGLIALEEGLATLRATLRPHRAALQGLPDFKAAAGLQQTVTDLVTRILRVDHDTMKALEEAEVARRAALASIERGEATLAGYRRILVPPASSATLVDRRG